MSPYGAHPLDSDSSRLPSIIVLFVSTFLSRSMPSLSVGPLSVIPFFSFLSCSPFLYPSLSCCYLVPSYDSVSVVIRLADDVSSCTDSFSMASTSAGDVVRYPPHSPYTSTVVFLQRCGTPVAARYCPEHRVLHL